MNRLPFVAILCFLSLGLLRVSAVDPARIRMWTAAKPCPQTQQKFGSTLQANADRTINVRYAYAGMTKYQRAIKAYAKGVKAKNSPPSDINSNIGAAKFLKQYANAKPEHVSGLLQRCATYLGGLQEVNGQAIAPATALPSDNEITVGETDSTACAEFCAFTSALKGLGDKKTFKSCSVAAARGKGKPNAQLRVAVSGKCKTCSRPKVLAFPKVNIAIPGEPTVNDAEVVWVKAEAPMGALHYDSVTTAALTTAESPVFEGIWHAQSGISAAAMAHERYDAASTHRRDSIKNQGYCSEDKLVHDIVSAHSVE